MYAEDCKEWLAKAEEAKEKLETFISNFHPCAGSEKPIVTPTAPLAQHVFDVVSADIASKGANRNPVEEFRTALTDGDVNTISKVLNEAWFGTPETTECWHYTGFREAVGLLEDEPRPDED